MELASRVDQRVSRWFGHWKEWMSIAWLEDLWMAEVRGWRVRGRPRLGWMVGVNVAFGSRGMTVEAMRQRWAGVESPAAYVRD